MSRNHGVPWARGNFRNASSTGKFQGGRLSIQKRKSFRAAMAEAVLKEHEKKVARVPPGAIDGENRRPGRAVRHQGRC